MANWKPKGYSKFNDNGAKEGLRQKMEYWANKDFNYEYGVSLGQAINLALEAGADITGEGFDEAVFKIFRKNLSLKNDKKFREEFRRFYESRANLNAREIEKDEKIHDEAALSEADNNDKPSGLLGE